MNTIYDTLLGRMQEKFFSLTGCQADDASDIGIRLKVLAGELAALLQNGDWLYRQVFPQTAEGQALELHAQQRGLSRKGAAPAKGSLTFSRRFPLAYSVPIPAGTVCAVPGSGGPRYVTSEAAQLAVGSTSVTVPAQAQEAGAGHNTAANTVQVLVTPPAGIQYVDNPVPFVGGADAEDDLALRQRLLESYRCVPNGTNAAFYLDRALAHEGVYSASVVPRARGTGTVDVYIAAQGGPPEEALRQQLQEELNRLREIAVDVQVKPCETVEVKLYAYVTPAAGYSMDQVRASCLAAWRGYFLGLKIGQPVLLAAAGDVLYHLPGVKNYSMQLQLCADRFLTQTQLAVAGELGIVEKQEAEG